VNESWLEISFNGRMEHHGARSSGMKIGVDAVEVEGEKKKTTLSL